MTSGRRVAVGQQPRIANLNQPFENSPDERVLRPSGSVSPIMTTRCMSFCDAFPGTAEALLEKSLEEPDLKRSTAALEVLRRRLADNPGEMRL